MILACMPAAYANIQGESALRVSLLNQDPVPAIAGQLVDMRLLVENHGDVAENNVMIEVVPQYPFELVPGYDAVSDIGTLGPDQSGDNGNIAKFKLRVNKDASAGTFYLQVLRYASGDRGSGVQMGIPVEVKSRESAEVLYIDKTSLIPGQVTPMLFTINNVGNAPLRELTFSWSNPEKVVLAVGSDNTRYIPYIEENGSVDLTYNVIADPSASTGLYSLNLNLQYLNPLNGTRTQTVTTAGVYVGGGTDFDVAFAQSSQGSTAFSVSNIGSNPAYSVTVSVPDQPGWSVTGPNAVIIGNLNKGDYTVASFALSSSSSGNATGYARARSNGGVQFNPTAAAPANSAAGNAAGIRVDIAYTDTQGNRQVVEKQVKLSSSDVAGSVSTTGTTNSSSRVQQGFFTTYRWYILGVVVVVVAFLAWRMYKKDKAKAKPGDAKKK
jgi:hypothetical protein